MDKSNFSKALKLKNIKTNDPFWNKIIQTVRDEVIPYEYKALNDGIVGAKKSRCLDNFRKAAFTVSRIRNGEEVPVYDCDKWYYDENNSEYEAFKGWVFQDSDLYKWLEAVAYSLINSPDKALEKKADDCIDLIQSAQLDNGYLDTLYIINDRSKIFTNLKDRHELYCFGHLAEAAVAYYEATGKDKLFNVACKYADLICNTFGKGKCEGYPGHEIAEMALIKLYRLTGKSEYLNCAEFFINQRGTKPFYFDKERNTQTDGKDYIYNQAHLPVREQNEAVGHAVRGVYLYSGMADVARETGDDTLFEACGRIFDNIEKRKMFITGGIGSTADGEAFSFDYNLPNDLAYCETCASIGLIFFAQRMLETKPASRYADVIERALYNTVLSGMSEDGKSFFYVNPLETNPLACKSDSRFRHVKPVRQKWFGCACCPPNLARLISSVGSYVLTENENSIFINQYIGGIYKCKNATVEIKSDYALNGRVSLKIVPEKNTVLHIRIPYWCEKADISTDYKMKDGFAVFEVKNEITVSIDFNIAATLIGCSNLVSENIGKAAVQRGPIIYCAEEADNGKNLHLLYLSETPKFQLKDGFIFADGYTLIQDSAEALYRKYEKPRKENVKIKLIPYYRWGNRGENEMRVYLNI